jgi:hypothetical protein
MGVVDPYAVVVPYWKETLVVNPWGLTDPFSVAEKLAINVAGLLEATGSPVAVSVVKILSDPKLVPPLLSATIRK